MSAVISQTARLLLDELALDRDERFVLDLLNEPAFLHHIGDRAVRDESAAAGYIAAQIASYRNNGFGLWRMSERAGGQSLGICGLVCRQGLSIPDVGYAVLQAASSRGYATEAAAATVAYARDRLGLDRVAAVTKPHNAASQRVLLKLGFVPCGLIDLPGIAEPNSYFTLELAAPRASE